MTSQNTGANRSWLEERDDLAMNFKIALALQGRHFTLQSFRSCSSLSLPSQISKKGKKMTKSCHLSSDTGKEIFKTILPKVRNVASNKNSKQEKTRGPMVVQFSFCYPLQLCEFLLSPCSLVLFQTASYIFLPSCIEHARWSKQGLHITEKIQHNLWRNPGFFPSPLVIAGELSRLSLCRLWC